MEVNGRPPSNAGSWVRTYRLRFPHADPAPLPTCEVDVISAVEELDGWIVRLFARFLWDVTPGEPREEEGGDRPSFRIFRGEVRRRGRKRSRLILKRPGQRAYSAKTPRSIAAELECSLADYAGWHLNDYFQIHAAFAANRGRGILLPGRTRIGKTTLALTLWQAGWTVYSDDISFYEPRRRLFVAYPRPFNLRARTLDLLRRPGQGAGSGAELLEFSERCAYFHPSWAGGGTASGKMPPPAGIRWMVFPTMRSRAKKRPDLRPIRRTQALRRLVPQAYNLEVLGLRGLDVLADLLSCADTYELVLGAPEDNAGLLGDLAERDPTRGETVPAVRR